jgi:serine/threonine protein phosphatase PrpC
LKHVLRSGTLDAEMAITAIPSEPLLLPGSSLEARGAFTLARMGRGACAGLASGAKSINPKEWVCEDSVLLARIAPGAWLAAVADAHWGGFSGEWAVRSALEAFERATPADPAARLSEAVYAIEAQMKERGVDASETTVLLAHLREPLLSWASVGDSVLWVLGRDGVVEHNAPSERFVGRSALEAPPASGSVALRTGDVVLLATDGILRVTSHLEREIIADRLRSRETALDLRVEALLSHVSTVGKDNLGVVALEV